MNSFRLNRYNLPLTVLDEYDANMEDVIEETSQPPRKKRKKSTSSNNAEDRDICNKERKKQGSQNGRIFHRACFDLNFLYHSVGHHGYNAFQR